jgi:methyl-accepting chemotaxis protein
MSSTTKLSLRASKKQFDTFEKNLHILRVSMKHSNEVKDRMVQILDRFETRFERMEKEMNQMNDTIDVLKLTYDNIDKTLHTVDNVIVKYTIPKEVERRINKGVDGELDTFLQALEMRDGADQFFTKHSKFKNAKEMLNRLSESKKTAIEELETEFIHIFTSEAYCLNPNKLMGKSISDGIELFPPDALSEMHKIAVRLDNLSAMSYRRKYVEGRDHMIRETLHKIYPDSNRMLSDAVHNVKQNVKDNVKAVQSVVTDVKNVSRNIGQLQQQVAQNVNRMEQAAHRLNKNVKSTLAHKKRHKNGTPGHMKSSEKFIYYMTYYLELLKAEKSLAKQLIFGQQMSSVYGEAIKNSVSIFIDRAEILTERNQTKYVRV